MGMTKAEFDAWAVTMGAAIEDLEAAAPVDVEAATLAVDVLAIVFKTEFLEAQEAE